MVHTLGNILLITLLGVLIAFNPMLIVVDILLVLKTKRPILNTTILTSGFVASLALLFVIACFAIDPDSQVSLSKLNDRLDIAPLVSVVAGALLLSYSLKSYNRQESNTQIKKARRFKVPDKPYQLFGFAFVKAALSATNIFAILILAKLATTNNWNAATGFVAIFWTLTVGIIPLAAIAYYRQYRHESLISIDKRLNNVMSRGSDSLITYALAAIGGFFVVTGFLNWL